MTKQKTFKRRVRERMEKTGESYASARAALIGQEPAGVHPDTSALRFALADAGIEISEALTLIIAGGAGAACMSFRYEAEDFTHFHLSGWNPFQSDIVAAVTRLGLTPDIHETTGARTAAQALEQRLETGVQIAWVDEYRTLAVLAVDGDTARVYDRQLKTMPTEELAASRARIRKQRHRLLAIPSQTADIPNAVREGLKAYAQGPANPPTPGMSLAGIARWADRIDATSKDGWATVFPPGKHREGAIRDMVDAIRTSGGGLLRNLQATGLHEAAELLDMPALHVIATKTERLADGWEAIAADPDIATLAERVRALHTQEIATVENARALLL